MTPDAARPSVDRESRSRGITRVLWATLAANAAVAAAKYACGVRYGSLSLQADAFHSISDSLANVAGLVGMRMAMKPPDEEHPYGHRKFELVVALGIAMTLFWAAFHVVVEAAGRLGGAPVLEQGWLPYAVMLATIAVNLAVTRWERLAGERYASPLLASDAAHTASDVYVSFAVLGSLVASAAGLGIVDLVTAFGIAFVIAFQGYRIVARNASLISDERVIDRREIERVVRGFPEVKACHRIRSRGVADDVFLDLHLHVDPEMPVREAHALAHRVEARLKEEFPGVHDVTIHIEPEGDPEE